MNKIKLLAIIFMSIIIISCSEDSTTEPEESIFDVQGENGFVGTVEGTNAYIAFLVAEEEAIVYVCNGDEEIAEWFRGNIGDPENISLTNGDGAQVSGKYEGNSFTGSVVLRNSSTHPFTASTNTGTETGVFRVYGDEAAKEGIDAGWILNSSGEERGSFKINSVFQTTPKKPKIKNVNDGTSNTLLFNNKSFSIERFFLIRSGSFSFVGMNG
ncbi:MAG: hypothetical protein KDC90_07790 [Ignavibacteriae bacterium]|nr:hypothetical protein [Ignavibacteriota bacterium]